MVGALNVVVVQPDTVRARIANAVLGDAAGAMTVGDVELMPHQRDAVRRLRSLLGAAGGALLADEVGLGKTYVALALAREATRPLIIAPASLRDAWHASLRRTRVHAPFVSYESLSRGRVPEPGFDLVVLDEAHHARNPSTRRYEAIVQVSRNARILMLSATPVHNGVADLRSLLALFLGRSAFHLDEDALGGCIIRREREALCGVRVPALRTPIWRRMVDDGELLRSILDLPPPLPPRDGFEAGALLQVTLARLWASSRAALRGALRRRLVRAAALEAALEEGRYPTAKELSSWSGDGQSVQLTFPLFTVSGTVDAGESLKLMESVRVHANAVRALLRRVEADDTADRSRAEELVRIHGVHGDARVIAFSQFAETARALFHLVRGRCRAAALTASGARLAEGNVSRREVLASFAPGAAPPTSAARIDVLITTDLASEGIDLQDASVVVHLDLPWTAARLEQRIGRVHRIGSTHGDTWSYALAPPASAAVLLRVEERLRAKLNAAGTSVGAERMLLPPALYTHLSEDSSTRAAEGIRRLLEGWRQPADGGVEAEGATGARNLYVACVEAEASGWIAALEFGSRARIVASDGSAADEESRLVLRVAQLAAGREGVPCSRMIEQAVAQLAAWQCERRVVALSGITHRALLHVRAPLLRRISTIAGNATLSQRAHIASHAAQAREVALRRLPLARERDLMALVDSPTGDAEWLQAVVAFGDGPHAPTDGTAESDPGEPIALLVLVRAADVDADSDSETPLSAPA